ncbi:MAG TPA: helix-turn-helix domain-containing protein, partial [Acidimicrobiales bacterium]
MPKVSPEHKDAVRRRILDAALACLERNDYRDVTTRELLSEAGLSTGTFYNYFASKEDLYETLA